ncbi:AAA family ATPase [Patescibacteria group bacterium]|nr:AAA family ATPase [Patescibacteria group bacterium]MBU0963632.1 AAA family ATPase [Patescibacteria group bacterium]
MKISEITINKYKSIKKTFNLTRLGKIHIFIGSNNVGKTNILNAIEQLYNSQNNKIIDKAADIKISFEVKSKYGKILAIQQKLNKQILKLDGKNVLKGKAADILNKHIIRLCASKKINMKKFYKDYQNFKTNFPEIFNNFYKTLGRYIPKIKLNKSDQNRDAMGKINVSFEKLGDGFQQVFIILLYLYHPQYTILLLEEPEIHLHPALQKKLLKILETENTYNQVFITTHSPIFIHTQNLHRLFRVTKEDNSTIVYSPRLTGHRINYARLKQELNSDNCEMFFADKVLLVEGPSDHILMRSLIDRFYKGENNIKVIQTYGKSNIDIYTDLLDVFNIPYVVLLDRDALYDTSIKLLQSKIREKFTEPESTLIEVLKRYYIYIFPNGSIERNYPKKYQGKRKHKPQNAMYAASHITEAEFNSKLMSNIKEVVDNL